MILVTGAAGYIGSVVTEALVNKGYEVVALDNLKYGHREAVHPKAKFRRIDLVNALEHDDQFDWLFHEFVIDTVVHLAAESVLETSMRKPELFYQTNVIGGLNLLNAMVMHDVKKIIFSSTAAVYGKPKSLPIMETDPLKPETPYGETKLVFERALEWYRQIHGINYIAFRYFNACGASENYGDYHDPETHIISVLLETVLGQRDSFQLFGTDYPTDDGTCVRDYVHVSDIAQAHLKALDNIDLIGSSTFNLANKQGVSNRQVIAAVEKVTGKTIKVEDTKNRQGDPPILTAASGKARDLLGWVPQYPDIDSMVETAWAWRQKHPKGY
jgi:UDP-glucose 4-epimerase